MPSRALLFFFGWFAVACHSLPPMSGDKARSSEIEFVRLMCVRLSYAPRIAWIKYQAGQPIEDAVRETQMLKGLEAEGAVQGLDPAWVRTFYAAQMAAFQQVQREAITAWQKGAPAPDLTPMDLQREIRPALTDLNQKMLSELAGKDLRYSPALAQYADGILRQAGFSPAAAGLASASLKDPA